MIECMSACLLLVEDGPHDLPALEALLQPLGHRVVRVASGSTESEAFERDAPALVICDLLMALKALHREQRELTEFVEHDVRTPLGALRAGLRQIRDGIARGPAALDPILARVDAAARRLAGSLEDLQAISRLEHDSFPVFRQLVTMDDVIRRVVDRITPTIRAAEITLTVALRRATSLSTDERLVGRVLENLLENAVRYAPSGGRIQLELRAEPSAIELLVCNDGPPIARMERARIFEKFARGATDTPSPGHAGLGLYFCKRAVEALGGTIGVKDVPGWHTAFSVQLPL